jgi:hypothetical protein
MLRSRLVLQTVALVAIGVLFAATPKRAVAAESNPSAQLCGVCGNMDMCPDQGFRNGACYGACGGGYAGVCDEDGGCPPGYVNNWWCY